MKRRAARGARREASRPGQRVQGSRHGVRMDARAHGALALKWSAQSGVYNVQKQGSAKAYTREGRKKKKYAKKVTRKCKVQ